MKEYTYLAWPLYLAGLLVILLTAVDFVATVAPLSPQTVSWRFGAVGMLSRSIMLPTVGLVGILGTAALLEHVRIQRLVMVLGFLASGLLLLAVGMFALDAVQLRNQVGPEAVTSFKASSVVALIKLLSGAVLLAVVGVSGLRMSRHAARKAHSAGPAAVIVRATGGDESAPDARTDS